ncbi:MAG: YitT family protein [Clostridia bacterium]|nr:YitT family protein [Clostridia bacterium]
MKKEKSSYKNEQKLTDKGTENRKISIVKEYALLTLGSLLIALEVHLFEIPNGFTIGGVSGLGIALGKTINFNPSTFIVILNVFLLLLGFIFLGKSCGIRTIYCSLAYSGFVKLFDIIMPIKEPLTNEPLLELVCVIIITAMGSALIFHYEATSGGTDIIAMILKKFTPLDVGIALLCVDFLIAVSAFFVFGVQTGIISVVGVFIRGVLIDAVIENFNSHKYFTIITTKPDEIRKFILDDLSRGATVVNAEGAYTGEKKTVLYTVCRRFEAVKLRKFVRSVDPDAFVVITTSSEIIGSGFRHIQ